MYDYVSILLFLLLFRFPKSGIYFISCQNCFIKNQVIFLLDFTLVMMSFFFSVPIFVVVAINDDDDDDEVFHVNQYTWLVDTEI